MAEWLCSGLQSRVPRFDSGSRLQLIQDLIKIPGILPSSSLFAEERGASPILWFSVLLFRNQAHRSGSKGAGVIGYCPGNNYRYHQGLPLNCPPPYLTIDLAETYYAALRRQIFFYT